MKKAFILIILIIIITGCNNKKNPDEITIEYKKMEETQIVENIEISNLNIKVMDGVSEINYKIKNKDLQDKYIKEMELIFKDKKNNKISSFLITMDSTLLYNQEKTIVTTLDVDLTKSSTYEVIIK